jgi:phosphoribosylanthranilate isomerase
MTIVKICGVQSPEAATVAAEAGANFVGMVFVPERRRRLDLDTAKAIVQTLRASPEPPRRHPIPKIVGLFADQTLDEVNRTINACHLDAAQLCGQEPLEYCSQVATQVIKVLHVGATASGPAKVAELEERALRYTGDGYLVTLDRLVDGLQGGTGHRFNWDVASELCRRGLSFLLAGGLSPENVAQAVAQVQPWGVDVSSGVETNGVKDHSKIREFVHNARA